MLLQLSSIGTKCMMPWAWLADSRKRRFLRHRSDAEFREAMGLGGPGVVTDAEMQLEHILGGSEISARGIIMSRQEARAPSSQVSPQRSLSTPPVWTPAPLQQAPQREERRQAQAFVGPVVVEGWGPAPPPPVGRPLPRCRTRVRRSRTQEWRPPLRRVAKELLSARTQ